METTIALPEAAPEEMLHNVLGHGFQSPSRVRCGIACRATFQPVFLRLIESRASMIS